MAFSDRTKILMAGNSDLVTFIHGDGQRELETVSFAKALEDNRYVSVSWEEGVKYGC